MPHGGPAVFIAERNTGPGGKLPLNTNGGGLSYPLYTFQHVRNVRLAGERAPDASHRPRPNPRRQDLGLPWCGGMFAVSGTIIMSNEQP